MNRIILDSSHPARLAGRATLSILLLLCAFGTSQAAGNPAPLAYEGFDGPPGTLAGTSGGTGWAGPWADGAGFGGSGLVLDGSLADPTGTLYRQGNRGGITGTLTEAAAYRSLSRPLGSNGTTVWISFLLRPDSPVGSSQYGGLVIGGDAGTGDNGLFLGHSVGKYRVDKFGNSGPEVSGITPRQGITGFLVAKVEFLAKEDRVTIHVNPTPGLGAPDSPYTSLHTGLDLGTVTQILLVAGGSAQQSVDELRLGSSYGSVAPGSAPILTVQPQSQSLLVGSTASLGVVAAGTTPFSYQWYLNGSPRLAATNASLVLSNVQPADFGSYAVVVTNSWGSITSTVANLILLLNGQTSLTAAQDTYITSDAKTFNYGASTSLTVDRSGGGLGKNRVLVQFDLSSIPAGAILINATLQMQATTNNGAFNLNLYRVTESWVEGSGHGTAGAANWDQRLPGTNWNVAGGTYDAPVVATLNTGLIGQHSWNLTPLAQGWCAGTIANDGILLGSPDTGTTAFTYDSREGTTPPRLVVAYRYPANPAPAITQFPVSLQSYVGSNATFSVTAVGAAPMSYQWFFNGTPLPGETNTILSIAPVQRADEGNYSVIVTNGIGTSESPPARLTVLPVLPPTMTIPPQNQTLATGADLTLSVGCQGSEPMRFQWRLNGADIPGATHATFTLANAQPAHSGSYRVVVFNDWGSVVSEPAIVQVEAASLVMADQFADQITLTAAAGSGQGTNTGATLEPGEPSHAAKPGGASVWISWVAPASGIATFRTTGSSFDTVLAVYEGIQIGNLVEVAADDDSGGYFTSEVRFNADSRDLYRIAVDGLGGASGNLVLTWTLESTGDLLPDILVDPVSQTVTDGSVVDLSVVAVHADLSYQWYFNDHPMAGATASHLPLGAVTDGMLGRYVVRVTRGSRGRFSRTAVLQLNQTGSVVEDTRAHDKFLDAKFSPNPLRLGSGAARLGTFTPAKRLALAGLSRGYSGSQLFNTYSASTEEGEPLPCGSPGGASQWMVYLAESDGVLFLNTDGSSFDTILAVYEDTGYGLGELRALACDDNSGLDSRDSALNVPVTSGNLYYLMVDGVGGAAGLTRLNYSLAIPSRLEAADKTPAGDNRLRLVGQPDRQFEIFHSPDLVSWHSLLITNAPAGVQEFVHPQSTHLPRCYYRATTLP